MIGSTPIGPTMPPLKILYEDDTLLVVDKPAGVAVEDFPKLTALGEDCRNGLVHRLDKDTSGVLLIAKTKEAFEFFQQQFKERNIEKKYICLVVGNVKEKGGTLETLLGRSPNDRRKQKVFLRGDPKAEDKREALTTFEVLERFQDATGQPYTLLEVTPKTGRKHQIRAHMAYLGHPIAGDTLYGFKGQPSPQGLSRQFLHAVWLKTSLPDGSKKEFHAPLPEDLEKVIANLQKI